MSHVHVVPVDIDAVIEAGPITTTDRTYTRLWFMILVGVSIFCYGVLGGAGVENVGHVWAAFYVNFVYFLGLCLGGTIISVIFQIVRAQWSPPIRRIAEANIRFFPVAFGCFLTTYFGKEYLFSWAQAPMPGREFWMEPTFVYIRFSFLFIVLFYLLSKFVHLSLRGDIALAQERAKKNKEFWLQPIHQFIAAGWKGAEEILPIQRKLSTRGPVMILAYAVVVSLFSFEMIMGMDSTWYSNLFGAFIFCSNVYISWAAIGLMSMFFASRKKAYGEFVVPQQFWDLGKMTFAFCMLWGYMFWSQFLTQWYGNLPEETQWLILRTREYPWKSVAWIVFPMAFIIPFILLLSRDVKKTRLAYGFSCLVLMTGVWLDRYLIIMPQVSPKTVPFGIFEIGIFIGFLGAYILCIRCFLSKYPFLPISHPLTHGSKDW